MWNKKYKKYKKRGVAMVQPKKKTRSKKTTDKKEEKKSSK